MAFQNNIAAVFFFPFGSFMNYISLFPFVFFLRIHHSDLLDVLNYNGKGCDNVRAVGCNEAVKISCGLDVYVGCIRSVCINAYSKNPLSIAGDFDSAYNV